MNDFSSHQIKINIFKYIWNDQIRVCFSFLKLSWLENFFLANFRSKLPSMKKHSRCYSPLSVSTLADTKMAFPTRVLIFGKVWVIWSRFSMTWASPFVTCDPRDPGWVLPGFLLAWNVYLMKNWKRRELTSTRVRECGRLFLSLSSITPNTTKALPWTSFPNKYLRIKKSLLKPYCKNKTII